MKKSARTYGKATAGPEGEVRLLLRRPGRDFERFIRHSVDEEFFLVAVESEGLVRHGIGPSVVEVLLVGVAWPMSVSSLPDPLQGFRPRFGLAERQMKDPRAHRFNRAVRHAAQLSDASHDSDPAGPVHKGDRHGCLQSSNSLQYRTATAAPL